MRERIIPWRSKSESWSSLIKSKTSLESYSKIIYLWPRSYAKWRPRQMDDSPANKLDVVPQKLQKKNKKIMNPNQVSLSRGHQNSYYMDCQRNNHSHWLWYNHRCTNKHYEGQDGPHVEQEHLSKKNDMIKYYLLKSNYPS